VAGFEFSLLSRLCRTTGAGKQSRRPAHLFTALSLGSPELMVSEALRWKFDLHLSKNMGDYYG
jgi:hypothetical protein